MLFLVLGYVLPDWSPTNFPQSSLHSPNCFPFPVHRCRGRLLRFLHLLLHQLHFGLNPRHIHSIVTHHAPTETRQSSEFTRSHPAHSVGDVRVLPDELVAAHVATAKTAGRLVHSAAESLTWRLKHTTALLLDAGKTG